MNALYWVMFTLAGTVIIAFYAVSLRPARSFSPARGRRSRWLRGIGLAVIILVVLAVYAWLFTRMAE